MLREHGTQECHEETTIHFSRTWRAVSQWTWYTCLKPDILCVPLSLSSSPDWVTVKTSRSPRAWLLRKSPQSVKFHTKSCGSVWFWPSGGADYIGGSNIRPAGQVRNKYRRNQDLCNSGIWLPIKIFIWICLLGWEYTTASCSAKWPQWGLSLSSGSWSRCKFQRQKWKVPQN